MKVVIERERWARGGKNGAAQLLNDQGNMCCLGFAGKQLCRMQRRTLLHGGSWPNNIGMDWPKPLKFLNEIVSPDPDTQEHRVMRFVGLNDDELIDDEQRERLLTAEFAKHGIEVEFI